MAVEIPPPPMKLVAFVTFVSLFQVMLGNADLVASTFSLPHVPDGGSFTAMGKAFAAMTFNLFIAIPLTIVQLATFQLTPGMPDVLQIAVSVPMFVGFAWTLTSLALAAATLGADMIEAIGNLIPFT